MLKKSPNVTLTNWKRLTNIPANVNVSDFVQAGVHWREFLVFLDSSSYQLYLYHIKMSVWSSMISNDICSPAKGCPLAVFGEDQDLVLVSSNGCAYKYFMESGHWKIFDKLAGDHCPCITPGYRLDSVFLVSDQPQSLILLWQEMQYDSTYTYNNSTKRLYLRRFQTSQWTDPVELVNNNFLRQTVSHISYAISQSNLYVNMDGSVILYCINAQNAVSKIPLPSALTKTTIFAVRDTMFSFGGQDMGKQPNSVVSRYNPDTKEWDPDGYMLSCRYSVSAILLCQNRYNVEKVFVVGGKFVESADCRITEVCDIDI